MKGLGDKGGGQACLALGVEPAELFGKVVNVVRDAIGSQIRKCFLHGFGEAQLHAPLTLITPTSKPDAGRTNHQTSRHAKPKPHFSWRKHVTW